MVDEGVELEELLPTGDIDTTLTEEDAEVEVELKDSAGDEAELLPPVENTEPEEVEVSVKSPSLMNRITLNNSNDYTELEEERDVDDLDTPMLGGDSDDERFGSFSTVTLSWEDLSVSCPGQGNDSKKRRRRPCSRCLPRKGDKVTAEKVILNNVSGIVKPGQFMAIMGASGAGKTTLLNTLSNKNKSDLNVRGSILINGRKLTRTKASMITAYVQQEDYFIGTLTIYEVLMFHARLRMDARIPISQKKAKVTQVLKELGLEKVKDSLCGSPNGMIHGISGGERKRLSIACELLMNPPLLFIDEPTSGLDSYMAKSVIKIISKLAQANRTVLCTIHQPTSDVFALFDRLYLMGEGGNAFAGKAEDGLKFFADIDKPCPMNFNPADHYVFTMAIIPGEETTCRATVQKIKERFASSEYMKDIKEDIKQVEAENGGDDKLDNTRLYLGRTSVWTQTKACLTRSYYNAVRNPGYNRIRVLQSVVMALLTGLSYLGTENNQESLQDKSGLFFFILTILTFGNVFIQAQSIPLELPIIKREYRNSMYGVVSYMFSRVLLEIPYLIVLTLVQWTIIFFMTGLRLEAQMFFTAYVICLGVTWVATALGIFIAATAGNVVMAVASIPITILPFFLFGGLYQNERSTPVYFYPIKYVSWFRYGFNMLLINEFNGVEIGCPNITTNGTSIAQDCKFKTGADVLEFYHVDAANMWFPNFFMLCITGLVLYIVSCSCLYCKVKQRGGGRDERDS